MELVVVVSPKRREGHGPEARGRRHRKRTRRRIPRLRVLELPEIL